MAVRVQWRALVAETMKQGKIREYFSNYQLPIADSGLRSWVEHTCWDHRKGSTINDVTLSGGVDFGDV
jgi:hypothetical protein